MQAPAPHDAEPPGGLPARPRRRLLAVIAWVAGAPLVLATVGIVVALRLGDLGGMRPSYRTADGDPRLAEIAREAVPMIAAIDAFYARNHACPRPSQPNELDAFRAALTGGIVAERHGRFVELTTLGKPLGWLYDVAEPSPRSCTLRRKLGWDPSLVWQRRSDGGHWLFTPGDGSPDREIAIDLAGSGNF